MEDHVEGDDAKTAASSAGDADAVVDEEVMAVSVL